jgi:DNA invertase Pin-like site-specific DNA recombinase
MKYGYARISSINQNLEGQVRALKKEGCEEIYRDKFTGSKTKRPEFTKLLQVLKEI